jgi:predicted RNA-binding protein YlxR (DUF448 family)
LGCGAREDQDRLVRLAATDQGCLIIDRVHGRGGYLHKNPECWQMFLARKSQYRAFHLNITRTAKEQLIEELKGRKRE